MSAPSISHWLDSALHPFDDGESSNSSIIAADSWLVDEGTALALDLHRTRFLDATGLSDVAAAFRDAAAFWDAAIASIPRSGAWFPRVELQRNSDGTRFVFRLRSVPKRTRSVQLATHLGPDPRATPTVKGPDTDALLRARTEAQARGADEAVILSAEGFVVEGAWSALLWWRGDALCSPSPELERVDSVTARSVITLATALGIDVLYESVTPAELDGLELWALSALHGIRIVTAWIDGPAPAEQPGRLAVWRARLDRLRRPL